MIGGDDLMNKRMTIGLFTDVFFPMIDGVVNVVDNYGKCLSKEADVYVGLVWFLISGYAMVSYGYKLRG